MADIERILSGEEPIYVFGYGSLTWKPDFDYDSKMLGYIEGYERRFWQASTFHRGTVEKPGRCLTLIKSEGSTCWGNIYKVCEANKIAAALDYLNIREQQLGGYDVFVTPVYAKEPNYGEDKMMYSVIYIANEKNVNFLGNDTTEKEVEDIATARGKIGHNIEYLFRITDFMREQLPEVEEDYLFTIDRMVRERIGISTEKHTPWEELMKNEDFYNLAHPTPNYKDLWNNAIREQMKQKPCIDRWIVLIMQIAKMKHLRLKSLEEVNIP